MLFALCGHPAGWEKGFKIHQELCIKEAPLFSVGERGFRVQRTTDVVHEALLAAWGIFCFWKHLEGVAGACEPGIIVGASWHDFEKI